jgi:hypothetical protein
MPASLASSAFFASPATTPATTPGRSRAPYEAAGIDELSDTDEDDAAGEAAASHADVLAVTALADRDDDCVDVCADGPGEDPTSPNSRPPTDTAPPPPPALADVARPERRGLTATASCVEAGEVDDSNEPDDALCPLSRPRPSRRAEGATNE